MTDEEPTGQDILRQCDETETAILRLCPSALPLDPIGGVWQQDLTLEQRFGCMLSFLHKAKLLVSRQEPGAKQLLWFVQGALSSVSPPKRVDRAGYVFMQTSESAEEMAIMRHLLESR